MNEESKSNVSVESGADVGPKAVPKAPPITEKPAPTSAIDQLQATSVEFKERLAEAEPDAAIGAVTDASSVEASPESQDNQAVFVLLALGALGGLILLSRQKT